MRRRSFHSSSIVGTKGNSRKELDNKEISISSVKTGDGEVKTKKSANPPLAYIISQKLNEYKTHDAKYNKVIQLLSDPFFLIACYEEIKGKPGNMTNGANKETLDGLK